MVIALVTELPIGRRFIFTTGGARFDPFPGQRFHYCPGLSPSDFHNGPAGAQTLPSVFTQGNDDPTIRMELVCSAGRFDSMLPLEFRLPSLPRSARHMRT